MTPCRALPFAAVLAVALAQPAAAQFGGMPGMPGSPGFSPRPAAPPPQCQELLNLRDDMAKHGQALQAAGKRKAPPTEACRLFKNFLAAESKMIKAIETNGPSCGVPADVPKQLKASHARSSDIGKRVCDAAAAGPRPTGPTLSDALNTPTVPDASTTRTGRGTFDTLTGSPLAR